MNIHTYSKKWKRVAYLDPNLVNFSLCSTMRRTKCREKNQTVTGEALKLKRLIA